MLSPCWMRSSTQVLGNTGLRWSSRQRHELPCRPPKASPLMRIALSSSYRPSRNNITPEDPRCHTRGPVGSNTRSTQPTKKTPQRGLFRWCARRVPAAKLRFALRRGPNSPLRGSHASPPTQRKTPQKGAFSLRAPGGIRTPNLLIRSQMLYPLSYGRSVEINVSSISDGAQGFERAAAGRPGPRRGSTMATPESAGASPGERAGQTSSTPPAP